MSKNTFKITVKGLDNFRMFDVINIGRSYRSGLIVDIRFISNNQKVLSVIHYKQSKYKLVNWIKYTWVSILVLFRYYK